MEKLLIFYLTNNDRYFIFDKFVEELNKMNNKNNIRLLIVNSNNDFNYYINVMNNYDIDYDIQYVYCPQNDYLPKVRSAIEYSKNNNFKYIMKYDNDILTPSYTFDYIYENLFLLENENVLTLSPTITTGIPSVEYFIDDFLENDHAKIVRDEFKKCEFQIQPGIMDYTPLNNVSINSSSEWDYKEYYAYLNEYINSMSYNHNNRTYNNYCKFYKGMHPIRHGFGNDMINDYIIKNKNRFFEPKTCSIIDNDVVYLCDMFFVIKTNNYDHIINASNLLIDGCDEVPINRYAWDNNLKHLIIKNGFSIHITYNWRWFLNKNVGGSNIEAPIDSIECFEENFIKRLYDTN